MANDDFYRNLTVRVPNDFYDKLNETFEWGEKNRVILAVLEWVVEMIEKHGTEALIIFLRTKKYEDLIKG